MRTPVSRLDSAYLCNFVIAGVAKCGTSSLHTYLDMHPDVCMSRPKEPHFFAFDERYRGGVEQHNALYHHRKGTEIAFGESSTTYSLHEEALRRLSLSIEGVRVLLLLRHPIERTLSHYRWLWALGYETRPLEEAVESEDSVNFNPTKSWDGNYPCYLYASGYRKLLDTVYKWVDRDRVYLVQSERLRQEPKTEVSKVFGWLGLKHFAVTQDVVSNTTRNITLQRTLGLERIAGLLPPQLKEKVDAGGKWRKAVKSALGTKTRAEPTITPAHVDYLSRLLRDEISFYESLFT